jgi:radical SAM superfamily enzyme YgiQ (UPF0313 family)
LSKLVALVNPNRLQPGVPPIALDYLASALERHGHSVRILDLCRTRHPKDAIRDFFRETKPDLVGISIRNLDDVVFNCFLAQEMKPLIQEIKRASDTPIVLGGSGFSIAPELLLDYYGADLGIAGEGEEALPMLVSDLSDRTDQSDLSDIPGLVYRDGSSIRRNAFGCADVNALHLAKRGWISHEPYAYKKGRKGCAGVQTKRGCSNRCIYCVVPNIEGTTVRLRDPADIADEMENLAASGVKRVFLCDSEFNYPLEHAASVCEEFIARGIPKKLTWQAYASPGQFNADLARKMKEAGCDLVITTIDSGDDAVLERLGKPFRTEDCVTCVRACQEADLNAIYCLTLGGPGETMTTVLKTLNMMQSLKPAKVTFGEPPGLRIYPGTPLETIVREEGFTRSNRNLHGPIEGNEDLLRPVYYLSRGMGVLIPMIQLRRKLGQWYHAIARGMAP